MIMTEVKGEMDELKSEVVNVCIYCLSVCVCLSMCLGSLCMTLF